MNRLILVGNGFDLAKGLESSYQHFIDWMWKNIIDELITMPSQLQYHKFVKIQFGELQLSEKKNYDYNTLKEFVDLSGGHFIFQNNFLKIITEQSYSNWVDIETEYFKELKYILQEKTSGEAQKKIEKLNEDFEQIKLELKKYLTKKLDTFSLREIDPTNLSENFNLLDFTSKGIEEFEKEFQDPKDSSQRSRILEIKNKMKLGKYSDCNTSTFPENVLFLNFNYTDIVPNLIATFEDPDWPINDWRKSKIEHIYIHGELNKKENPIIFGYGDENDEIQSEIEKRGGDYLNNIKTINYLKTPNYKKVLSFLDSANYQVFIMGHSCGLSDKTLLKTIFEHPHCISIRPFYYIDKNGNNNYDDIVKNIYRTFTDKALIRDKVVNQEYCRALKI